MTAQDQGERASLLTEAREVAATAMEMIRLAGAEPQSWEHVATKSLGDYVTEHDVAVETRIREEFAKRTPHIPLLGEESGGGSHDRMWVVDPIDGTTNFARRYPIVGVSIALVEEMVPTVGVVGAPFLGHMWTGILGEGAHDDAGHALNVRGEGEGIVAALGFPFRKRERMKEFLPVFHEALMAFEDIRRPGTASLDLTFTAGGSNDGYFELGLGLWDIAAGSLLVREAGGIVTDWEGSSTDVFASGDIVAGSPRFHRAMMECIERARTSDHTAFR